MMFYIMLTMLISILLLLVYLYTSWVSPFCIEKNSAFECGFDPLSNMRSPFSARFFVLVVLFLIFDIEVSLLFPVMSMVLNFVNLELSIFFLLFMTILLLGLFYEWYQGALDWVSF
uniref:NADH-ubiquinone oxidoreductase chain 3 n=1 Tax=Megaustenia imperator imperator TaxID=2979634 RepID=A0A977K6Z8_9EUPU|nr:NADH dehydrogenase subunit 3 [Megaustenia imperator imperator]